MKSTLLSVLLLLGALLVSACSNQIPTPTAVPTTAAAVAPADPLARLRANAWQWVSYKGPTEIIAIVSDTPDYTLTFNADGSLAVKAECNQAAGTYQAADGTLTITLGATTLAACGEYSYSERLFELLPSAALYRFDGNDLVIELLADGGTLTFLPLGASAVAPAAAAAGAFGAAWEQVDCTTFGLSAESVGDLLDAFDCGYVNAPQFHGQPDGPTLKLAVARARSSGASPAADPLFMENGGPGGRTIAVFGQQALPQLADMQALLASRDLVFVDQRGTGYSEPRLICPEKLDHDIAVVTGEAADDASDWFVACRDRLAAAGVDFDAFDSVENAADMYLVAETLGYDSFNFYGASYGTLLAQYVMDQAADHKAQLRSVIVDAVVLPDIDFDASASHTASYALRNLFAECAQDTQCNSAYPDLERVFFDLIDRLNTTPVTTTLTVTNAEGKEEQFEARLDGNDFILATFNDLYTNYDARHLPLWMTQSAKTGDFAWVAEVLTPGVPQSASAMHAAVLCARAGSETFDATTLFEPPYAQMASLGPNESAKTKGQCALLGVKAEPPFVLDNRDTPTLLLNGTRDPVTPLPFGKRVAEGLTTAYVVTVPGSGHGSIMGIPCSNQIVLAFLAEPGRAPDMGCLAELKPRFEYP